MSKLASFLLLAPLAVLAADSGYVKGRGSPTGPGMYVDGKYVGPAGRFTVPEKYEVEAGEHQITLRDPRYKEFTTKVTVTPKKTAKFRYKMERLEPAKGPFGRLRFGGGEAESFISVTAGDTTPVYLNGVYWGFIDEFNNAGGGMLLPAGTYRLKADSPINGSYDQDVTVEANKVVIVPLKKK